MTHAGGADHASSLRGALVGAAGQCWGQRFNPCAAHTAAGVRLPRTYTAAEVVEISQFTHPADGVFAGAAAVTVTHGEGRGEAFGSVLGPVYPLWDPFAPTRKVDVSPPGTRIVPQVTPFAVSCAVAALTVA